MDYKDFKHVIKKRDATEKKHAQSTYVAQNRGSRPRAKQNVVAPHLRNI